MKKYLLFTIIIFLSILSLAQGQDEKNEHEKRVKQEDFPHQCLQRLEPILIESKGNKFYREFDGKNYFFELKTTFKNEEYSIKFTEAGELVDIECLFDFDKLKQTEKKQMLQYLKENYKKFKVKRFQIQYNREVEEEELEDDEDFLKDFLEMDLDDLVVNYEMEVEILTEEGKSVLMELLFNSDGKLLMKRKVKRRDEDYILY